MILLLERSVMLKTLYNKDKTRLQLVKSIPGNNNNYLFLPGGPGVDSDSLMGLVNELNIAGNYWLIDLILNGTNDEHFSEHEEIYLKWPQFLVNAIKDFENPILIGHSFGGYLPLFIPELDNLLKGFIMIGSTPTLKSKLFQSTAEKHNLPPLSKEQNKFIETPNLQNLKALYEKETFYFFSKDYQKQGLEDIVKKLIYCLKTEHWWYSGGYKTFSESVTVALG